MANVNKCSICGLRVRSTIEAHNSGPHHLRRSPHSTGAALSRISQSREMRGVPSNIGNPTDKNCEHKDIARKWGFRV